MDGVGDAVMAEAVGVERGRPATYAAGRVCEHEGCTTVLSVYNSRTRCSRHDFDASLAHPRTPRVIPGPGRRHATSLPPVQRPHAA
jgi:hypothetical protein